MKMVSWKHWKGDRCFKDMEKYVPGKTQKQIKSWDQRMKIKHFLKQKNDIIDAIPLELANF